MDFKTLAIAVCVFVMFAGGAFAAFQVADTAEDNAPTTNATVHNESIPQEYDIYQLVDKTQNDSVTGFSNDTIAVYNSSNTELTRGTDYKWNSTDGAVKFLNTSSTNDSETATITYEYRYNTQAVRDVAAPLRAITRAIGQVGYLAAGLSLVVFLIGVGAIIARFTNTGSLPESNR